MRADPLQRVEDAAHRTRAQRCITIERRGDRAAGDRAEHEPAPSAGVTEIQRLSRCGEPGDADAADVPGAAAAPIKLRAKLTQRLCRIEHILAFEQAAYACLADRECAKDQGTYRDRFIARHPSLALQRTIAPGSQRSAIFRHDLYPGAGLDPARLLARSPSRVASSGHFAGCGSWLIRVRRGTAFEPASATPTNAIDSRCTARQVNAPKLTRHAALPRWQDASASGPLYSRLPNS